MMRLVMMRGSCYRVMLRFMMRVGRIGRWVMMVVMWRRGRMVW